MKNRSCLRLVCVMSLGVQCCWALCAGEGNVARVRVSEAPEVMEDARIETIMERFGSMGSHDKRSAIAALRESGTRKARSALLAIALGREGQGETEWAAMNYVEALENKSDSVELLKSRDSAVQHVGLLGLRGCSVNRELRAHLQRMLQSGNLDVRRASASVVRQAPDYSCPTKELAIALIESAETVDSVVGAGRKISTSGSATMLTDADYAYRCITWALSDMKGADAEVLQSVTPTEPGHPRDCVLTARAWLGDRSVKPDLMRIVRESKLTALRRHALAAYSVVGTVDDLDFLREVAQTDPLAVEPKGVDRQLLELEGKPTDRMYPVRIQAERLIKRLSPVEPAR